MAEPPTPQDAVPAVVARPAIPAQVPNPLKGMQPPPTEPPAPRSPRSLRLNKFLYTLKIYAWRLTAAYLWVTALMAVFGQVATAQSIDQRVAAAAVRLLAVWGFEPVNGTILLRMAKLGWLLLITGFRALQIFGFALYAAFFPLIMLIFVAWSLIKRYLPATSRPTASDESYTINVRPLTMCVTALFFWFILLGDAQTRQPLILGAIIALTTFAFLFTRVFRRAKPITDDDAALLRRVEDFGQKLVVGLSSVATTGDRFAGVYLVVVKPFLAFFRRLTVSVRGRRGSDRVSLYVLLEYVVSLTILGAAAVLLWALVLKVSLLPFQITLGDSVAVVAAHFIPGMTKKVVNAAIPLWVDAGSGITAFILFVLYLAPAASVLPSRQEAHIRRLRVSYERLRGVTRRLRRFASWVRNQEKGE